jgi:hypothetical protein
MRNLSNKEWYSIGIGGALIAFYLWNKYGSTAVQNAANAKVAAQLHANSLTAGAGFQVSTPALGTTLESPESTPYTLTNTDLTVDPTTGLDLTTGRLPIAPIEVPIGLLDSAGVSGGF